MFTLFVGIAIIGGIVGMFFLRAKGKNASLAGLGWPRIVQRKGAVKVASMTEQQKL